jgi:hypothetical protein
MEISIKTLRRLRKIRRFRKKILEKKIQIKQKILAFGIKKLIDWL